MEQNSNEQFNAPAVIQGIFARFRVARESLRILRVSPQDEEIVEGIGLLHEDAERELCRVLQFCEEVAAAQ